jgi:hypothetical protein
MADFVKRVVIRSVRARILRFLGISSLASMLVAGLVDLVASSGTDRLVFRPLGTLWMSMHENSLQSLHASLFENGMPWVWTGLLLPILSQAGIVVFGCLAVLFLALAWAIPGGTRRRREQHDPRYDRRRH